MKKIILAEEIASHSRDRGNLKTIIAALTILGSLSTQAAVLEEIVVTAQKRAESIQDVPISVAAISGEKIAQAGINDMMDLSASIPNVKITDAVNNSNIYIRGIGSGIDRGLEQSVGMFIDGIYMGRSRQYRAPFLDLERVEVLRGPQAVLFGKNTVAGAVKVESAKPNFDDGVTGNVALEYDPEYKSARINGVVNAALTEDFAIRIAASDNSTDGFLEDTNKNKDEIGTDEQVFRLSALWEASDNLTLTAKYEDAEFKGRGSNPEISRLDTNVSAYADPTKALTALASNFLAATSLATDPQIDTKLNHKKSTDDALGKEQSRTDSSVSTLKLDYDFNSYLVTMIAGYSEYESNDMQDVDFLPISFIGQNNQEEFDQTSFEFRVTSPGGETIDWIAGAYWQENNLDLAYDARFGMATLSPLLAAVPPLSGFAPLMTTVNRETTYELESDSWSAFGQATWNIADNLRLTFGGRYSIENKEAVRASFMAGTDAQAPDTLEELTTIGLLTSLGITATPGDTGKRNEKHFSPSLKVQWDLNGDVMLYASAEKGFKSGGFNSAPDVGAVSNSVFEYEEEEVQGLEIGMKSTLLDGAATFNINYFHTEFTDLQVTSFVGTTFILSNAGSSTSQGIEADAKWAVTDSLTLSGSVSWLNSEYDDYKGGPCTIDQLIAAVDHNGCEQDLSGKVTPYAPKWSGNLSAEYIINVSDSLELRTNLDLVYSDEFYYDGDLDDNTKQDSYTKVNARIALGADDGIWEVALVGNNLTDETTAYWGTDVPLVSGSFVSFADAPRTVAIQGRYNF